MFIDFYAHPLHILWVIKLFAIHYFFFPLVYICEMYNSKFIDYKLEPDLKNF